MICPSCGTQNRPDRRFCSECGTALAVACPSCGAANEATDKFCGSCGSPVDSAAPPTAAPVRAEPVSERRVVSVLFADLVGFTALAEHRDAEETRELLSRYFETSRQLITRYGGIVEKFIGDAVMAVWGTPVATEDDAERAVRAGLDLLDAVAEMGADLEAGELRARVGVLTGEAAVNRQAESEGMVAGDLVNTASRVQSVAPPGGLLVGESTRRASEAAIAYEEAGVHELKGRDEPIRLWRALRVVGGRMGALRFAGLETAFAGRDREMRLVKELFHATADEGRAHLVSVIGVAGVGKTRLSWEFEKYIDGLADDVWWHRGRCLAYGEGVAYWALAEMVRSRAGIVEGEEPESALAKLRAVTAELITDPEERGWAEPRLAHLLGLEERTARDQADLFSAWRLFFERMAEQGPVEMIFEDLQWADAALLDFIEYLMEWSKDHSIFVLALARPDLMDRRPNWGAGRRNFTSLALEPLAAEAMDQLLHGLAPGLPEDLRRRILERAEGIPLYAVETVRMLLDRGALRKEGDGYRVTGRVEDLAVPESLHALIAARLDGLTPEERRLLQDASVLGKTFTKPAAERLGGVTGDRLDDMLTSLVRKEFLSVQSDPRSPERGQYGFLQDLVRRVAYETLSRKERKARHLAVADYLQTAWSGDEDEVVEVVASHMLEAHRSAPDAPDAPVIKERAREVIVRAGEHAASLAAHEEARRYFDQAAELAEDAVARAELLERAGLAARASGDGDVSIARFEEAISLLRDSGASHPAARVAARLAEGMWDRGRFADALEEMDRSFQVLADEEPDADLAELAAQLGRFLYFAGKTELAQERIETALDIAEALWLPEVLSMALNTKAVILYSGLDRRHEGYGLLRYALELALENDVPQAALRAYYNLADLAAQADRYSEGCEFVEQGLALARRIGDRWWEWQLLGQAYPFYAVGEWDRALAMAAELPREKVLEARGAFINYNNVVPRIHFLRGDAEAARGALQVFPEAGTSDDVQERVAYEAGHAGMLRAERKAKDALEAARGAIAARTEMGSGNESVKEAFLEAVEAAFELDDLDAVEDLLGDVESDPPGKRPRYLHAHTMRFRSRLTELRGETSSEAGFKAAAGMFRELAIPFWMAVTLLEHGEWLGRQGRGEDAGALLTEAREIFERLRARPWLERANAAAGVAVAT